MAIMPTIDSLLTATVVSVEIDDSLQVIKHIFENTNFHHLLVVSDDKLIGIISDRDFLKAISPQIDTPSETSRDSATMNKRAHQIMNRNPSTLHLGATIQSAINLSEQPRYFMHPCYRQISKSRWHSQLA